MQKFLTKVYNQITEKKYFETKNPTITRARGGYVM